MSNIIDLSLVELVNQILELDKNTIHEKVLNTIDFAIRNTLGLSSEIKIVPPGILPRFEMKSRRFNIKK